ncbi:MAG: barstar family protein [Litorimonas sp.]
MVGLSTEVHIDWAGSHSKVDVLKSILEQVKAPDWHGLGLDALEDSLVIGNINKAQPPYRFRIKNLKSIEDDLIEFQNGLVEIFLDCVRKYDGSSIAIE